MPAPPYHGLFRTAKIPPCVLSLEDLRRLYRDLTSKTKEALERHLAALQRPPEVAPEQFDQLKERALAEGGLMVTVQGADGEQIVATSDEGLASNALPERVHSIAFDSAATMQVYNVTPLNRFTLRLDFTEPPSFNTYDPWDEPTPNSSQLQIIGSDATWVTGVYESTLSFFRKRRRRRAWLHTQHAFNALNWLVGFPAALWVVFRLDSSFPALTVLHSVLRGALYVYVFLLALLLFRGIIWAFRWIFPLFELEGARSNKARAFLGAILGSILLGLAYDIVKTLFW